MPFRWWIYRENPYPNRFSAYLNEFSISETNKNTNDSIRFKSFDDCVYRYTTYLIWNDESVWPVAIASSYYQCFIVFDRTQMNFSIFHTIKSLITVERAFLRMTSYLYDTLNLYVLCPVFSQRVRLTKSIEPSTITLHYTIHHSIHNEIIVPNIFFFFYFGSPGFFLTKAYVSFVFGVCYRSILNVIIVISIFSRNWFGEQIFRLDNDSINNNR